MIGFRKLNESERMQSILEENMSRKAKEGGAFRTGAVLSGLLGERILRKQLPNLKMPARWSIAAGLAALGGVAASKAQSNITDSKLRRLSDPDKRHLVLRKSAETQGRETIDLSEDLLTIKQSQTKTADTCFTCVACGFLNDPNNNIMLRNLPEIHTPQIVDIPQPQPQAQPHHKHESGRVHGGDGHGRGHGGGHSGHSGGGHRGGKR